MCVCVFLAGAEIQANLWETVCTAVEGAVHAQGRAFQEVNSGATLYQIERGSVMEGWRKVVVS